MRSQKSIGTEVSKSQGNPVNTQQMISQVSSRNPGVVHPKLAGRWHIGCFSDTTGRHNQIWTFESQPTDKCVDQTVIGLHHLCSASS